MSLPAKNSAERRPAPRAHRLALVFEGQAGEVTVRLKGYGALALTPANARSLAHDLLAFADAVSTNEAAK